MTQTKTNRWHMVSLVNLICELNQLQYCTLLVCNWWSHYSSFFRANKKTNSNQNQSSNFKSYLKTLLLLGMVFTEQSEEPTDLICIMCRSNRTFNIPSPWANCGHLTILCAWGVGNLICKVFPWGGDLTFA